MNTLLNSQLALQEALEIQEPINAGDLCNDIRDIAFFLNQEVVELIEEIAGSRDINKPWKQCHSHLCQQPVHISDKVKSEAIDVLKFAMNICLKAGITPGNIEFEFYKVHNKNYARIRDGY